MKKDISLSLKAEYLILFLVLISLSILYYSDIDSFFPSYAHAWTQGDHYALSLGYLGNNFNFFKPCTFNLLSDEGITAVDFPIHQYIISCIMRLLHSTDPLICRLYFLSISFAGYFFIFRLAKLFTQSFMKSMAVVIFTFTIPLITYYQFGFIPSIAGFSSLMAAYYFYFVYLQTSGIKQFTFAIIFFTLAVLTRTTLHIFLFAILLQQTFGYFKKRKLNIFEAGTFILSYSIIIAWSLYKSYLTKQYGTIFLDHLMPAANAVELKIVLQAAAKKTPPLLYSSWHLILLGIGAAALIIHVVRRETTPFLAKQLFLQVFITVCGACIFFLLMAKQFTEHEYYLIDTIIPAGILFLCGVLYFAYIKKSFSGIVYQAVIVLSVCGMIFSNIQSQKDYYTNTYYNEGELVRQGFTGSDELLDSLGIDSNARILVMNAHSSNIPLLLLNRKGYTVISTTKENIVLSLKKDFDYIAMLNISLPYDILNTYLPLAEHLSRKGGNDFISVFSYDSIHKTTAALYDLLNIKKPLYNEVKYEADSAGASDNNGMETRSQDTYTDCFEFKDKTAGISKLLFEGEFKNVSAEASPKLVIQILDKDSMIYYFDRVVFFEPNKEFQKFQCLFQLPFSPEPEQTVKCYLWNDRHEQFFCKNFKLTCY